MSRLAWALAGLAVALALAELALPGAYGWPARITLGALGGSVALVVVSKQLGARWLLMPEPPNE
jgi:hypothetical protein